MTILAMTKLDTTIRRLADGLSLLRSATTVAGAVEMGRHPAPADLHALGIDPRAFATIGHG